MASREDGEDRRRSFQLFAGIAIIFALIAAAAWFLLGPAIGEAVAPGLGLKDAALIAFGLSVAVIIVMTLAAGDGLLGELQFMLLGFAGFFVICWLMLAWIF